MNTIGRDTCIQSRNQHIWTSNNQPVLDHIFIRFGPASPTPPPPPGNLAWNSSPLGTNVIIPDQNYKRSSWHHFHYPQVTWWSSFTCQRNLMANMTGCCHIASQHGRIPTHVRVGWSDMVGANQPIHSFLGGKDACIQQRMSVWVGSPKSTGQWRRRGRGGV